MKTEMTPREAIIELDRLKADVRIPINKNRMTVAIDMAQAALQKLIPRKPAETKSRTLQLCPNCNRFVDKNEQRHGNINIPKCKWCGQALDWSDDNESIKPI